MAGVKKTQSQTPTAAKKANKSKTAPTQSQCASAPVPAPVPEPTPAPAPAPTPAPIETVAAENLENTVMEEDVKVEDEISNDFTELLKKLNTLTTTFATLKQDFKSLEKKYMKEMKVIKRSADRKKKALGSKPARAPSGFVKPTRISEELASFLEKPAGTEMARTEVTREINKYIRTHDLQDTTNGRKINPDDKLRKLLQVPSTDDLTYFNLQKYLSKHFPKDVKPVVETATAT